MSILYNLSIRNKLIGITLFVTILALGIGFTLVIVSNIKSFKEDMKNNTIVTAQVVGEYCVSPLIFEDRAGAEEILAKLADVPSITKARIYDADGELFVSFMMPEEPVAQSPIVLERSSEFAGNYLHVYQPIIYKDVNYGTIYLQASTRLLDTKISNYLRYMALLMVGLTLASVFLAVRLQRIISKPILNLAGVAQQIAEEKDYSIRVQKKGHDETGLLYDGFNNMLDQVQRREIERDRAESALRGSEEKFRTLTSNIPGAIYRCANDPDWTIDFISDVIEQISGFKASDFIQNKVRSYASIIFPDDVKMVEETVQEAISMREPYLIEYRIVRSDDSIRWVYEKGQGIFSDNGNVLWLDGAIFDVTERKMVDEELAKHRDHLEDLVETRTIEITEANKQLQQEITERKKAEIELRDSEEKFRSLVENANDIIYSLTPEGVFSYVSPNWTEILGHRISEVLGQSFMPFIHPDDLTMWMDFFKKVIKLGKKQSGIEYRIQHKNKQWRWHTTNASALKDKEGNVVSYIGIAHDFTERKEILNDLEMANQHLRETQAQLVQSAKMASLGKLVAGIAHEINTPIGAVNSMQDTLFRSLDKLKNSIENQYPGEQGKESILKTNLKVIDESRKVIYSGTDRVINIVKRLRSFARLDEAELKTVDIHEGLEDTLTLIHHDIKHNIQVTRNYGNIPPIACYPGRLNQVFLNILVNAKQSIKGKGYINITTYAKKGNVFVEIKDNGIGIEKKHIKKVFDPGFTTKGVGVGTGLGLSICYQIMKDHLGEILVESVVNKGSTFTLILPMDLDDKIDQGSDRSKV